MSRTVAVAGQRTSSTGRSCSRVTNGFPVLLATARAMMPRQAATMRTASQNGKKPLFGPSVPQPMPMRSESQITSTPPAISTSAVVRSAARMPDLFLEQAALGHELLVDLVFLLHPGGELGARHPGGLERPVGHIGLELGSIHDLLQHALVPGYGLFRHVRRPEDPAQHQVGDVGAEGFLDGRDVLPFGG